MMGPLAAFQPNLGVGSGFGDYKLPLIAFVVNAARMAYADTIDEGRSALAVVMEEGRHMYLMGAAYAEDATNTFNKTGDAIRAAVAGASAALEAAGGTVGMTATDASGVLHIILIVGGAYIVYRIVR